MLDLFLDISLYFNKLSKNARKCNVLTQLNAFWLKMSLNKDFYSKNSKNDKKLQKTENRNVTCRQITKIQLKID